MGRFYYITYTESIDFQMANFWSVVIDIDPVEWIVMRGKPKAPPWRKYNLVYSKEITEDEFHKFREMM
jgi:hypothetical protein